MKLSHAIILCGLLLACTLTACSEKFTRIEGGQVCPADGPCLPLDARNAVAISLNGTDLQLMSLPADSLLPAGTGISALSRTLLAEGRAKSVKATLIQVRDGDVVFLGPDQQEVARVAQDDLKERRVVFFADPDGLIISTIQPVGSGGIGVFEDDCSAKNHEPIKLTYPPKGVEAWVYVGTPKEVPDEDTVICINNSEVHLNMSGIGVVVQVDDNILPPDYEKPIPNRIPDNQNPKKPFENTGYLRRFSSASIKQAKTFESQRLIRADLSKRADLPKRPQPALSSMPMPVCNVKFEAPKLVMRMPICDSFSYARCERLFYVKQGEKVLWCYSLNSRCTEGHLWFVQDGYINVYSNGECPEFNPPAYLKCQ